MVEKQELCDGIRFAGRRAAAALEQVQEWDYQLSHEWTTSEAFRHVAAVAPMLEALWPAIGSDGLHETGIDAVAAGNREAIDGLAGTGRDELRRMIVDGHEVSAAFAETLDQDALDEVVTLGGYTMPKGEIVAQVWIQHAIAHAYEASARWPIL